MGRRGEHDVDIVHAPEKVPYPLPDGICLAICARHIVEHINRADRGFINVMNEWWRILKPRGRLMVASVYGMKYQNDPAACAPVTQDIWTYFMPDHQSRLWERYRPKPWKMIACSFNNNGTVEAVLEKLPMKEQS